MNLAFFKYFTSYILKSRTRQKLLTLAIIGLFLSSFSLIILQGVMGGLQKGVVTRSKSVSGAGYIRVPDNYNLSDLNFLKSNLNKESLNYVVEYEIELLAKNGDALMPVVLHGVDLKGKLPTFLEDKNFDGVVLGASLASSLKSFFEDQILFISPSHSDFLITEIPRQSAIPFSDILISDVEEVDSAHAWVSIEFLQNLTRSKTVNRLIFFDDEQFVKAKLLFEDALNLEFISWESKNKSLVWALKLETTVMIILFIAMSLLVSLCITSGFMIFFSKVRIDLLSFWVLGFSRKRVFRLLFYFSQILSLLFIGLGLFMGIVALYIIDSKSFGFVPDIFVEQNIPISVSFLNIFIAFTVPYFISTIFSFYSFQTFKSENNSFLKLIRTVS